MCLQYLVPPKGLMSKWWATPFFNYSGTLSVDTFFFISGFLAAYMLMIKLDKVRHMGPSLPSHGLCPHRRSGAQRVRPHSLPSVYPPLTPLSAFHVPVG